MTKTLTRPFRTFWHWVGFTWKTHLCFSCEHHLTKRKLLEYYWYDKGMFKAKAEYRVYCFWCCNYSTCVYANVRPPDHPDYEVSEEKPE